MFFDSTRSSGALLCITVLTIGGCASKPTTSGFSSVQQTVSQRTGRDISWNTSSADDARADAAIAKLLDQTITPDIAAQVALLNNRELQATFEDMGIAQADLVRAGLLKNPIFNGAYEFAAGGGPAKVNLSISEDFLSILQIPLRRRVAGAALESAQLTAANATLDLTSRVRSAFFEYEAAQQIATCRESTDAATKAAADTADRLHAAGNLSDLDFASEQAEAGESLLQLAAAKSLVELKRDDLNELMGLTGQRADAWKSAGKLADVPSTQPATADLEAVALRQRLDLAAAKRAADAASGELGVARQFAFLSDASTGASAEREHDRTWETGPAISVPIPLFDFGGASVAEAAAKSRQMQRRFQAMAVRVQAEVRRAQSKLRLASEQSRCFRETVLPSHQRIVDQTMLRYDGMLSSVFQLLSARQSQLEAQIAAIESTRDFWIGRAELERAVGGELP